LVATTPRRRGGREERMIRWVEEIRGTIGVDIRADILIVHSRATQFRIESNGRRNKAGREEGRERRREGEKKGGRERRREGRREEGRERRREEGERDVPAFTWHQRHVVIHEHGVNSGSHPAAVATIPFTHVGDCVQSIVAVFRFMAAVATHG
jgi:hypothetical protein